jgi:putative sigma-54 modulation protein
MKIDVTFKNFDHTPALDGVIKRKSEKLTKYTTPSAHLTWNCYVDNDDQVCEVSLSGFKGADIQATSKTGNLYKSVDQVIHKLERQLKKRITVERSRNRRVRLITK